MAAPNRGAVKEVSVDRLRDKLRARGAIVDRPA
jgi:hypothetical protein